MVLHKVSAPRQNVRPYCIANSLTLFHHVSYGGTHSANLQPFAVSDAEENRTDKREGEVTERLSLVRIQPFAWEKKRFL